MLPTLHPGTLSLAETPTRLKALSEEKQNQLMNWGYAVCDAALRTHAAGILPSNFDLPSGFPFGGGVG